uniref:G-protein coupled receptors family 1 profile domain-containing protein n=1 Tax=Mycena chlorophos TaxID=658473 RepID=A0ABQ0KZJ9_MYCCL|nr:predicted protein [Mycena chlorophos]
MMLTPEDASILQGVGRDWYQGFICITNETILLTVYAVLVAKAGSLLLSRQKNRSRTYLVLVTSLLVMFILAVTLWALDLTTFIYEPKFVLVQDPNGDLADKLTAASAFISRVLGAQAALYAYMALIGDAIVIHRLWMLRSYFIPWAIAIPLACLLGSVATTLMLTYCVAAKGSDIVFGSFKEPMFCKNVQQMTYVMPMVTTAAATLLAGFAAWQHRKRLEPLHATNGGRRTKSRARTSVERIFMLLVHSGFFYFLFFLIQVLTDVPSVITLIESNTPLSLLIRIFNYCSSVIVGAYPTAIIVFARTLGTHSEDTGVSSSYVSGSRSGATGLSFTTGRSTTVAITRIVELDGDQDVEMSGMESMYAKQMSSGRKRSGCVTRTRKACSELSPPPCCLRFLHLVGECQESAARKPCADNGGVSLKVRPFFHRAMGHRISPAHEPRVYSPSGLGETSSSRSKLERTSYDYISTSKSSSTSVPKHSTARPPRLDEPVALAEDTGVGDDHS